MTHFEMVEKLCEKANVTYEEAKAALEAAQWDLLDAVVLLEQEGRIKKETASHSTQEEPVEEEPDQKKTGRGHQVRKLWNIFLKLLKIGNENNLVVSHKGHQVLSLPVTVVVVLLIFTNLFLLVVMAASMCFGVRYSFTGEHLGKESVNNAMNRAADMAESVKESVSEEMKN